MDFGLELLTATSITILPGQEFCLELYSGDRLLPLSVGTDSYGLKGNIMPYKVLAATGRRSSVHMEIGMGSLQAKPAQPIPLQKEDLQKLVLKIKNNRILAYAKMKQDFSLRIYQAGKVQDISLARHDVKLYWDGRGEFTIPLGQLVS